MADVGLPFEVEEEPVDSVVFSDSEENKEGKSARVCVTCLKECGDHWCRVCKNPCHTIICGKTDGEEGYGAAVICNGCFSMQTGKDAPFREEGTTFNKKQEAFIKFFKRPNSDTSGKSVPVNAKRQRTSAGHGNTKMAICLECFEEKKNKFWLSRYNKSTVRDHIQSAHKNKINHSRVVPEDAITAREAIKEYRKIQTLSMSGQPGKKPGEQMTSKNYVAKTNLSNSNLDVVDNDVSVPPKMQSSSELSTSNKPLQGTLDKFVPIPTVSIEHDSGTVAVKADWLANKVAKLVLDGIKPSSLREQRAANTAASDVPRRVVKATNLLEFIEEVPEYSIFGEQNSYVLRCTSCHMFLSNPLAVTNSRRPSGSSFGSLATGLNIENNVYDQLISGHCEKWYHQKEKMINHLSTDTHVQALQYTKSIQKTLKREVNVVRNQLRTALGVVKSKAAARQYEDRIAELHAAGADVGDFGHSRKLFPQMISVACAYIDKKSAEFLSTPLPNTGMPPHFYVTADKSTNHRVTNQISMICPVVAGKRQGIPLNLTQVYTNAEGTGGTGDNLADAIFRDAKDHVDLKEKKLLQMQGKVVDGQYINQKFIAAMNNPVMEILKKYADSNNIKSKVIFDLFWWPTQWDPGHWVDKIFSKFKDSPIINRLLKRVALYHQLFGHGKMHSVAVETSKELSLPFRVTNTFAHQRFMSSSYLSLKNLEESLEVYIETFKDHDNRLDLGYKLYGRDFVIDLLGLLDLLWPLVVLMLQSQLQWCPGWKFESYIPAVQNQLTMFIAEMDEDVPCSSVSPRLNRHLVDVTNKKYGNCKLEEGWLVVEEEAGRPVVWKAREPQDCMEELKTLAMGMKEELDRRFATSYPELNKMLHKCLDFGVLFAGLCGIREDDIHPVDKQTYSALGATEFRKCVEFVSQLPHVKEKNMELSPELSSVVFWRLKSALMEVVWGKLFTSHFPIFFRQLEKVVEKPGAAVRQQVVLGDIAIPFKESSTQVEIVEFSKSVPTLFSLVELFRVKLTGGKTIDVVLQEDAVIRALYTDSSFYTLVGFEFCLLFDIMYAKTGTEAVAESFYRVVEKQEMEGKQSLDVLASRSKIDWCLPPVLQCDSALTEMAQLYVEGDKKRGLKKHYVPVYSDKRSLKSRIGDCSKVVERIKNTPAKLPFLL